MSVNRDVVALGCVVFFALGLRQGDLAVLDQQV